MSKNCFKTENQAITNYGVKKGQQNIPLSILPVIIHSI